MKISELATQSSLALGEKDESYVMLNYTDSKMLPPTTKKATLDAFGKKIGSDQNFVRVDVSGTYYSFHELVPSNNGTYREEVVPIITYDFASSELGLGGENNVVVPNVLQYHNNTIGYYTDASDVNSWQNASLGGGDSYMVEVDGSTYSYIFLDSDTANVLSSQGVPTQLGEAIFAVSDEDGGHKLVTSSGYERQIGPNCAPHAMTISSEVYSILGYDVSTGTAMIDYDGSPYAIGKLVFYDDSNDEFGYYDDNGNWQALSTVTPSQGNE